MKQCLIRMYWLLKDPLISWHAFFIMKAATTLSPERIDIRPKKKHGVGSHKTRYHNRELC
jgi:hypothetical protein